MKHPFIIAISFVLLTTLVVNAQDLVEQKLPLITSGITAQANGSWENVILSAQTGQFSVERPASMLKSPQLVAPRFAQLKFGSRVYQMILDQPQAGRFTLYVDANGNDDLSDDPPAIWSVMTMFQNEGNLQSREFASFQLPLTGEQRGGDGSTLVTLIFFCTTHTPELISYFVAADYGYHGEISVDGTRHRAMLVDGNSSGRIIGHEVLRSGMQLRIDINNSGEFDSTHGEFLSVKNPFKIKGTTYEVNDLAFDGTFKLVKSSRVATERAIPVVGERSPTFVATRIDGTEVNFPADYRGKIVMLDFWATWCSPCLAEMPRLRQAIDALRVDGFEILGISLDEQETVRAMRQISIDKAMTWPQLCDEKGPKGDVVSLFGVQGVPAAFLVDGDTGEILAAGNTLRGEMLIQTLTAAIAQIESRTPMNTRITYIFCSLFVFAIISRLHGQTTMPSVPSVDHALLKAVQDRKNSQMQRLDRIVDRATISSLLEIVKIEVGDGVLKLQTPGTAKLPPRDQRGGSQIRFTVTGSKAIWVLAYAAGPTDVAVAEAEQDLLLVRIEPQRPDTEGPWKLALMKIPNDRGRPTLSINAQFGPSADRDVVYFESNLNDGAVLLTARARERTLVDIREANLRLLTQNHPEAVRKYLVPLFRDLSGPDLSAIP